MRTVTPNVVNVFSLGRHVSDIRRRTYRMLLGRREHGRKIIFHIETVKTVTKNPYERLDGFVASTKDECVQALFLVPHFYWSVENEVASVSVCGELQGWVGLIGPGARGRRWIFNAVGDNRIFGFMNQARYRTVHDAAAEIVTAFWCDERTVKPETDQVLVDLLKGAK